jgi:hypothetical protein
MLIQPSLISRELATLRGLDLMAEAERERLAGPLRRQRRADRRAAVLAWLTRGRKSTAPVPSPTPEPKPSIPYPRTAADAQLPPAASGSPAEGAQEAHR